MPLAELPQQSDEWQKLVDEMAAEDEEVTEYIRNLEERDDEIDESELRAASGDMIAREFERYLRRRDRGGGGPRRRPQPRLTRRRPFDRAGTRSSTQ